MTGTIRTSEGLDTRRRRLLYHCWHRGTREMDLIMGRFADEVIGELSEAEVEEFERLAAAPDHELYSWVSGAAQVPGNYDTGIFRRLLAFNGLRSE